MSTPKTKRAQFPHVPLAILTDSDRQKKIFFQRDHATLDQLASWQKNTDFIAVFCQLDKWFQDFPCLGPRTGEPQYDDPHIGQWEIFIKLLVNIGGRFTHEQAKEFSSNEQSLEDTVKQIENTAKNLAKLIRQAFKYRDDWGLLPPYFDDPIELLIDAAERKRGRTDGFYSARYQQLAEALEDCIVIGEMPTTADIVDEIAYVARAGNLNYAGDTAIQMRGSAHKFKGVRVFFTLVYRYILQGLLPLELIDSEKLSNKDVATILQPIFANIEARDISNNRPTFKPVKY